MFGLRAEGASASKGTGRGDSGFQAQPVRVSREHEGVLLARVDAKQCPQEVLIFGAGGGHC